MNHLVFVFGTLKEGFPNFPTNRGVRRPGAFLTKERYPFYLVGDRHSPWLINIPGQGERIIGQVFEVDSAALEAMDKLERISEPDGYRRIVIKVDAVNVINETNLSAFAYLKQAQHFAPEEVRFGPLQEYTVEHAALYRARIY